MSAADRLRARWGMGKREEPEAPEENELIAEDGGGDSESGEGSGSDSDSGEEATPRQQRQQRQQRKAAGKAAAAFLDDFLEM